MAQTSSSGPTGCIARLVMVLALLTALITVAAGALFLVAILPLPDALRPWIGLGIFLFVGVIIVYAILNRIHNSDAAIRQRLDRILEPLGFSLQESGEQRGRYTGVRNGHEMQVAYAISGVPQRPTYHLEIAVHSPARFRMAIGMARFQFQFDEASFGQPLTFPDPDFAGLAIYTDEPEEARRFLARPEARSAILDLLSASAPGVRNLTLADGVLTLRYRHLSLKGLSTDMIGRWMDDLIALIER